MSRGRFVRRNRVDERIAAGIAAIAGVASAFSGARPTGSTAVDVVMVALAAAAVVWAAASAQWWALAVASGIGAVIALDPLVAAVGGLGFLGGLNVGTWRTDQSVSRSIVGGIVVNTLIRSDLDGFFGLSAIIGISVAVALAVAGLLRRPSAIRRTSWISLAVVGGLGLFAGFFVGIAALGARPDVSAGARSARSGIAALNQGDYDGASRLFKEAANSFERADGRLGGALAKPGLLLPGVAQNLSAGADLSEAAAEASAEAAAALRQIDPSTLTVSGGSIDLAAVRAVEAPLVRVRMALTELQTAVDGSQSAWLLGPVADELNDLEGEFGENEPRLDNAIDAVRLAPQMLGEEQVRRYLVIFTTPAEARGVGGFIGNYALLEVDSGKIRMAEFGRATTLDAETAGTDCSSCAEELVQWYGQFGITTGPDGSVGRQLWKNITMPAHFPYIADAAHELWPQARPGEEIDGVILMDPYVVQALMRYSGPIPVPELDVIVQPDDAAQFILEDQYLLVDPRSQVRRDALETLGRGAISAILAGSIPDPPTVAQDLGPLIAERRLLMWTDDEAEQALLDRVGMLGSIPPLDPVDGGFSVSVTNASASKIEVFLDRTTEVRVEGAGVDRHLHATVTLKNNAPSSGLPDYVIGNSVDLPNGYSRLYTKFYGPTSLTSVTLDGEPFDVGAHPEAGWMAYAGFVDLGPGEERVFDVVFGIPQPPGVEGGDAQPTLWEQPLVNRPSQQ